MLLKACGTVALAIISNYVFSLITLISVEKITYSINMCTQLFSILYSNPIDNCSIA